MSMCSHHEYKSGDSRSSKFTVHAAVQLQRRHNFRYDFTAADQLLEELNGEVGKELKNLIHNTFPTCNVNLIHAVNAPQMYGMYLLRKEEMQLTHVGYSDKELILYHVTTKSRALESLKRGLNWRRIRRSKFGRGVSFSDDADYANYYADNSLKEDSRVIIVCAVLVNKTHPVSGKHNEENFIVPPGCADTTVSPDGRVYVKYNDYDFYPLYFMYYQRTSENLSESKYFRNNPHNKWHQNNLVMQQQREQEQAQRLQAQRDREQAQLEFSRKSQQELRKQCERDQSQKLQAKQEGEQSQAQFLRKLQQELQEQREQKQLQRLQAQREREQAQLEFSRKLQQELQEQRECDQSQKLQAKQEGEQSQVQFLQKLQQELQKQLEREQAQRQLELMAQRERMREWRQQELQEQREREQAQRERMREWRQQELQEQREREQAQRQLELMAQRERMREWRQQELREQREREQEDELRQPLLEQTHRQQEHAQQPEINTKLCCLIL